MGRALMPWTLLAALLTAAPSGAVPLTAQDHPRDRPQPRARNQRDAAGDSSESQGSLARAAAEVRSAWLAHAAPTIVAGSSQLVVQLPGADPSAAVGAKQAAALLADFLNAAREVELVIRTAREVEPGRGYVEMVRRYRLNGTQDVRTQNLFLGYRHAQQGWVLVELRAIEP